jgi:SagB-type dehydrogenase family enzyme
MPAPPSAAVQTDPALDGELLRLHPGVGVHAPADGGLLLHDRVHGTLFPALTDGQRHAIGLLRDAACRQAELLAQVGQRDGDMGAVWLLDLLARLRADGWLQVTLVRDGRELLTVIPHGPARPRRPPWRQGSAMVLSRFAVVHREGQRLVLESPRAAVTVHLCDPLVVSLLGALATPRQADELPEFLRGGATDAVLETLRAHSFLVPAGGDEDGELSSCQWSPHELWFHHLGRMGRPDLPYGGTYWGRERFAALPAARAPLGGPAVDLPRPDLAGLAEADRGLAEVMEARESIRAHDDERPMTVRQLGEFLYRSARVRGQRPEDGHDLTVRPYPAGGSIYELELYPVVSNVSGLSPGMYHYDPFGHRLTLVPESAAGARRLLAMATRVAVMPAPPQVLIVISARFGRLMWKYQTMAYSVIMKNVGALYGTMYLVATAMDLAPCALGGGSAADFELATGTDPLAESSVGEFVLGSKPPADQLTRATKYGNPQPGERTG